MYIGGDMRRAVTFLQCCTQLCIPATDASVTTAATPEITTDIVIDISGEVSTSTVLVSFIHRIPVLLHEYDRL